MSVLVSDFKDIALPALPEVPGMTSAAERRYLYWLASSQLSGKGRLVELGSWLGRSTLHLAAGLSDAGHEQELHCFDGFTWAAGDSKKSNLPLKPGDDFQKYFEANLAPFKHLVTAHRTRLADVAWSGGAIEMLFLDAPKNLPEITRCLEIFGPSLMPGRSIIAIQDYQYFPAYALGACMYALRDSLELVHVVSEGSTVAFRLTAPIELAREKPAAWNIGAWSPALIEAGWSEILSALPEPARDRLAPAKALHLYDCGARQAAIAAIFDLPMTELQRNKFRRLSRSQTYLSYPELFTAAGFPGTPKQNMLSKARRLRDWARALHASGRGTARMDA